MPEELTIEKLKGTHSSYPRNPNIAKAFFKAGYIESWGRGTNRIISESLEAGLPEPIIEEDMKGIRVTFLKDIYTESYLQTLDLNRRQINAVLHTKINSEITNDEYQKLNNVSDRTALRDLQDLINKGLFERKGTTGRGTVYLLKR